MNMKDLIIAKICDSYLSLANPIMQSILSNWFLNFADVISCKRSSEGGHNYRFISISIYPEELSRQARSALVLSPILKSIPFIAMTIDYKFSFNVRHLDLSILKC